VQTRDIGIYLEFWEKIKWSVFAFWEHQLLNPGLAGVGRPGKEEKWRLDDLTEYEIEGVTDGYRDWDDLKLAFFRSVSSLSV
jgi:hypothetical protein